MLVLKGVLLQAVTHSSYVKEHGGAHNELLEFSGDAVLQLCVSDLLLKMYPKHTEGQLTRMRHQLVDSVTLAEISRKLQLGCLLRLGKGEIRDGARDRDRMLANLFEALLGAVYQLYGLEVCQAIVQKQFSQKARDIADKVPDKQVLMEWCQKQYKTVPTYVLLREDGEAHDRIFTMQVWIQGSVVGEGTGTSKKEAQIAAAEDALHRLQLL